MDAIYTAIDDDGDGDQLCNVVATTSRVLYFRCCLVSGVFKKHVAPGSKPQARC
jgi:hypothetical protein